MAFKLVGGAPENFVFEGTVTAGTAIAEGDVLAISGNVLAQATSASTIHTIVGVAAETITTSASKIKVIPIVQGQLWEADCNADTHASNQFYESYALTDCTKIANDSTDVTGATGVFLLLQNIGAVGNRKVIGEFTRLQSTST